MKLKFVSLILIISLIFTSVQLPVFAENIADGGGSQEETVNIAGLSQEEMANTVGGSQNVPLDTVDGASKQIEQEAGSGQAVQSQDGSQNDSATDAGQNSQPQDGSQNDSATDAGQNSQPQDSSRNDSATDADQNGQASDSRQNAQPTDSSTDDASAGESVSDNELSAETVSSGDMPEIKRAAVRMLGVQAAAGNTIYVGKPNGVQTGTESNPYEDLATAVEKVQSGGTIIIMAGAYCNDQAEAGGQGTNQPLVIDKPVTIQGMKGDTKPSLYSRRGGYILKADVTLKDFDFNYIGQRNGIFANGYSLTIENVGNSTAANGGKYIDIYAGGFGGEASGENGQITISGTSTAIGDVYGGGYGEDYTKQAVITLNGSVNRIGNIYGSGNGSIVAGSVTINLNDSNVRNVYGDMGEGVGADVVFTSHQKSYEILSLTGINKLTVAGGTLRPKALNNGVAVEIRSGGALDLTAVMKNNNKAFSISQLIGGGTLLMGNEDTLTVAGSVSGITDFQSTWQQSMLDTVSGFVTPGNTYIKTPLDTKDDAFTFTPNSSQKDIKLVKTVVMGAGGTEHIEWVAKKESTVVPPTEKSLQGATVNVAGTYLYNGGFQTPEAGNVSVSLPGGAAVEKEAYTILAGNNRNAGTASITVTAKENSGYTGEASGTFTISPVPITVTADPAEVFYGQSSPKLTYQITSGSLVSGESLNGSLQVAQGEMKITQGTLTDNKNPNYKITFIENTFTQKETTPKIEIIPDNRNQTPGGSVQLQVNISNPYDAALKDLPTPELTWQAGSEAKQKIVNNTFVIPATVSAGTTITIEATTGRVNGRYAAGSAVTTVKVSDKTSGDVKIGVQVSDLEYGNSPSVKAELIGETATGKWSYTYCKKEEGKFQELTALLNSSGLLPAGSYLVKVSYEDSSRIGEKTAEFTVIPKKLTVGMNAAGVSKVYDKTVEVKGQLPTITLRGAVEKEKPILQEEQITYRYEDAGAGKDKVIIADNLKLTDAEVNANYTLPDSVRAGKAEILAMELEVIPRANQGKKYGQTDPELLIDPIVTPKGERLTVTGALGRAEGENAGSYAYTIGSLSAGNNYRLVLKPSPAAFVIEPASVELSLTSDLSSQHPGESVAITVKVKNRDASALIAGTVQPTSILVADREGTVVTMESRGNGTYEGSYRIPAGKNAGDKIVIGVILQDSNYERSSQELSLTVAAKGETPLPWPDEEEKKEQQRLEIKLGISEIPDTLKEALKINTAEEVESIMIRAITEKGLALAKDTLLYDVKLMVSTDGGKTWDKVTKDNFPTEGLEIVLPYPQGTGKDTHEYTVIHMFTEKVNGNNPGEMEFPAVSRQNDGLHFRVTGLSPILLGWKEITQSAGGTGNTSQGGNTSQRGNTQNNQKPAGGNESSETEASHGASSPSGYTERTEAEKGKTGQQTDTTVEQLTADAPKGSSTGKNQTTEGSNRQGNKGVEARAQMADERLRQQEGAVEAVAEAASQEKKAAEEEILQEKEGLAEAIQQEKEVEEQAKAEAGITTGEKKEKKVILWIVVSGIALVALGILMIKRRVR